VFGLSPSPHPHRGYCLSVRHCTASLGTRQPWTCRVYKARLSYNVREKDIQQLFSGYGCLLEVDLKNGYGFVEFEDSRVALYELNGKELCGQRVIVEHARAARDGDR
jgi:RNA recognition motif-containing protein